MSIWLISVIIFHGVSIATLSYLWILSVPKCSCKIYNNKGRGLSWWREKLMLRGGGRPRDDIGRRGGGERRVWGTGPPCSSSRTPPTRLPEPGGTPADQQITGELWPSPSSCRGRWRPCWWRPADPPCWGPSSPAWQRSPVSPPS